MATVDVLAESLSRKTGTKFEVLRGHLPAKNPASCRRGANSGPMRYGLRATRGDFSHTFQGGRPMKLWDLTRWLASICDMVDMGFIPVDLLGEDKEKMAYGAGYDDGWDDGRDPDSMDPRKDSTARGDGMCNYMSSPHHPGDTM